MNRNPSLPGVFLSVFIGLIGFEANIAAQLPPPAEDINRPAGITQNPTRPSSWTDAQGRSYSARAWEPGLSYDDAKASPYPLPNPLILKNGQPVNDADTWWNQRRPEILEDFRREMYGRIPANTPKVTWEVTATEPSAAGGLAIKKTIVGHIDNSRIPQRIPRIHLTSIRRPTPKALCQ